MSAPPADQARLQAHVAERLARLRDRIAAAARRVGRSQDEVELVLVSKQARIDEAIAAVQAGALHLGENRLQPAEERMTAVAAQGLEPTWHFIGRLQRNKARKVLERFDRIDSLDSLRLAERLDRIAVETGSRVPVLIQVNTAADPAKQGLSLAEAEDLAGRMMALPNLQVEGLMTIGALAASEQETRGAFRELARLAERLRRQEPGSDWRRLSMGMTGDFEIAIEEGATEVRVGSAVFGA